MPAGRPHFASGAAAQDGGSIALRTAEGVTVRLPVQAIAGISSAGVNTHKPVLEDALLVEGPTRPFDVTYIAQGASWSPAYRIVLRDPKRMRLSMSAVLRNELEDFRDARVTLISGFPNIEYAGTEGLMSPGMTLEPFFQRLSNPGGGRGAPVLSQQAVMYNVALNAAGPGADFTAFALKEPGASSDIHYRDIGKLSMASGASMYLALDDAETDYERVVEWTVSNRRNERGQIEGHEPSDDFWDVIRFANPFKAPMTTAPVEVFDGDRLLGQSTAYWTNPGQATSAKITKALSVSGHCSETESDGGRTNLRIDGYDYYKTQVDDELRVRNYRGVPVKLVVRLGFTGEHLSASPEPGDRQVLASGVYSVNRRESLQWTLDLQPGEAQTLAYRYSVLVRR